MDAIVEWEYVAVDKTDIDPPDPGFVIADVTCVATTDDGQMRMFRKNYLMRSETLNVLQSMIRAGARS